MEAMPVLDRPIAGIDGVQYGSINGDSQPGTDQRKKWPSMFWIILKFLCLYSHESVVSGRSCYICNVKRTIKKRYVNLRQETSPDNLDYSVMTYERSDSCGELTGIADQTDDAAQSPPCAACESLWWDGNRIVTRYSEDEIGVREWNRKGSNILTAVVLFIELVALLYAGIYVFTTLWGQPTKFLRLMTAMTLMMSFAVLPTFCVLSKLRNGLTTNLAFLTTLNVRYLIVRMQLLDLPRKGLPGKPFLLLCLCCPTLVALYRAVYYLHISRCDISAYAIATSVVAIYFEVYLSLTLYILYAIRVSFQRQLNLVLSYLKENEVSPKNCRGVLLTVASDFACFRQFCDVCAAAAVPSVVLCVAVRVSLDYILYDDDNMPLDKESFNIAMHFSIIVWLDILQVVVLYMIALGGLQVSYIWDSFFDNLLRLDEDRFGPAWKDVLKISAHLVRGSQMLMASVVVSVISLYVGFNFSAQEITYNTEYDLCS